MKRQRNIYHSSSNKHSAAQRPPLFPNKPFAIPHFPEHLSSGLLFWIINCYQVSLSCSHSPGFILPPLWLLLRSFLFFSPPLAYTKNSFLEWNVGSSFCLYHLSVHNLMQTHDFKYHTTYKIFLFNFCEWNIHTEILTQKPQSHLRVFDSSLCLPSISNKFLNSTYNILKPISNQITILQ